ncbi:MAG TPA: FG-GAP-like repeat-containing protein, partial [Polyangiaceae bacterium]|nr:FG-GAP-like repeat-containing protein [Polyangiaceae bacterium]
MHEFPRLTLWAILATLLAPLLSCANLDPIALGECGNGVIDPGEDCDSFDRLDMTCRPPGSRDACRFDCAEPNLCTAGYACGQDALCRAPSGRFEHQATLSDPAKFIVAADFDANGEVDLLAGDDTGTVISYQSGSFQELDTIDLSIDPANALITGGQLTQDAMADVAYASTFLGNLGVSRGTPEPTLAGTVYPTLAIPADHAVVFGLDADPMMAGDEAMGVIDVPNIGTLLLAVETAFGGATPSRMLTEPGVLPSLAADSLGPARGGRLDPSKPCEQYVLAFQDSAFVGTPCTEDGAWNAADFDPIAGPMGQVPIPPAPIDLGACPGDLDQAFVLDADQDGDLDVVLTPRGQFTDDAAVIPLCWLPGPISLPGDASTSLVASPYPLVALATAPNGNDERVLDLVHLNGDGIPDLISNAGIFTSQSEPCPFNLTSHIQADPSIFFCSTGSDESLTFRDYVFAAVGDVNGDQRTDVALTGNGDESVQVHLGHGDGTFAVYVVETEGVPYHVVFGDFDGDGLDDLMFADKVCPQADRCASDQDPSDILTVAFGRVTGGPEEPRSLGRVPGIQALQTARFPADSGFGIDATVDLGVLAQDPTDGSFSFAIMGGNTRRELQANFYLSSPEAPSEYGTLPTNMALGRFVQSDTSGMPVPAAATDPQQDMVVAAFDFASLISGDEAPDSVQFWLADVQGEAKLSASRLWLSEPVGGWDLFASVAAALATAELDGDAADEIVYA